MRVDPVRYIASDGSVSVVDLTAGKEAKQIVVGCTRRPSSPRPTAGTCSSPTPTATRCRSSTPRTRRGRRNDFDAAGREAAVRQRAQRPGHQRRRQDAVRRQRHEQRRGRDRVCAARKSRLLGCFPTGWYPAGLVLDAAAASRSTWPTSKASARATPQWKGKRKVNGKNVFGYNSHDYLGTISLVPLPSLGRSGASTPERCWPTTG